MEKLNLVKASENEEHISRHSDVNSLAIGSKSVQENSQYIKNLLKTFDNAYGEMIAKNDNPGRQVFAVECDRNVGTNAIVSVDTLTDEAKGKIFKTTRDIGTRYEQDVDIVLISEKDMPKTNIVHGVYGPYGPTGNAGIYTMIYGEEGRPFPREMEGSEKPEVLAENNKNKEYWDSHVFLCTPKEFENNISELKKEGKDVKILELRLKSFLNKEDKGNSPLKEVRKPDISKTTLKLNSNLKGSSKEGQSL